MTVRTSILCLFVCLCNISALLQGSPWDTPYTGMCSEGTSVWLRICPKIVKHFMPEFDATRFIECHPTHTEPFTHSSHIEMLYTHWGAGHVLRELACAYMFWFRRSPRSLFIPRDWHPVGWRSITASGRQLLHHFSSFQHRPAATSQHR